MTLDEYTRLDGLGLAALVARKEVTPMELAQLAAQAIAAVNPAVRAVVETYADRIEALDENTLGAGPFRGVPFLMKDVFGHEAGRKIEFGSRLCEGMLAEVDTAYCSSSRRRGSTSSAAPRRLNIRWPAPPRPRSTATPARPGNRVTAPVAPAAAPWPP